jgi:HAD superfamily hydrolase (TIGR01662 family)
MSKKRFVKIFENSLQKRKWKSKHAAYSNMLRDLGVPLSDTLLERIIQSRDYLESHARLFPHVIPMLKRLKRQGYKVGIISNTSIFATEQVRKRTKLLKFIDYPVFSYAAGMIKPDPGIFRKMLKIAKVKPDEAIMIGDKIDDDVIPAKELGINTILFKNPKDLKKKFLSYGIKI